MVEAESFADLARVHRRLDGLFLDHQLALLSLDLHLAREKSRRYESALLVHIHDEETLLIPVYEARTATVPGGAVELFTGEHAKLRGFIAEFFQTLTDLAALPGDALKPAVIKLFDRQAICKGLSEHYHAREGNILFPWLDRITHIDERAELLRRCASFATVGDS